MQKTQQKTPSLKQIQKAILVLNEVLDKKGDETLTVTPIELFESGAISRTSFFRNFNTIDSIIVFAKAEITEVFTVYFQRKALFAKFGLYDFFTSLLNSLYSHKEAVKLLIRRPSKKYWHELLTLIKPIVDRTTRSNENELIYELFVLVFVHTLGWWIENGYNKENIPVCVNRMISFLNIVDLNSRQNIFIVEKLLETIQLIVE